MKISKANMKAHLIFNPEAGQREGYRRVLEIIEFLREQRWAVAIRETKGPADVTRYADQAVAQAVDVVLVVGGDGTVNGVANSLAGSDVALGVLPMGTGNVLAAELGLVPVPTPLHRPDPLAAARVLSQGQQRWIDLGRIIVTAEDGSTLTRYFVLWAGIGFDAAVTRLVETELRWGKRRFGALSYVWAGINTALRHPGTQATIRFNDQVIEDQVILVGVSNAQLYAGAVRLAAKARLDDGWLDAYIFEGRGLLAMLRHLVSILIRRPQRDPSVETFDIRRMSVEADDPLPVHIDGEPIGTTPISLEVVPQALKLLVPSGVPTHLFA